MDRMFDAYSTAVNTVTNHIRDTISRDPDDSEFIYRQATRAKALDATRGMLPAASLSNLGIYGTGQAYEALLLRMRAHPLPEAQHYSVLMLHELRKVIPSFLRRVDLPERGGRWIDYLATTRSDTTQLVDQLFGGVPVEPRGGRTRRLRSRCRRTNCSQRSATAGRTCPSRRCSSVFGSSASTNGSH